MKKVDYEKIVEALKRRDEESEDARKRTEREWRAACTKDMPGHLLGVIQYIGGQIASLQAQIDAVYPLGVLARSVGAMAAKLDELDKRIGALEKKPTAGAR